MDTVAARYLSRCKRSTVISTWTILCVRQRDWPKLDLSEKAFAKIRTCLRVDGLVKTSLELQLAESLGYSVERGGDEQRGFSGPFIYFTSLSWAQMRRSHARLSACLP